MFDITETPPTPVAYQSTPHLQRTDLHVAAEPGIEIRVRKVSAGGSSAGVPILLVHGARAPGVPSFDLDVPGGSLAATLADSGHLVYLVDARNYGGSTRLSAMSADPAANPPQSRTNDVIRDIHGAVEWICRDAGVDAIAALGWATGSQWLAAYAARHPHRISHLISYNGIWPVAGPWAIGDPLEDPERPGELRPGSPGAYGLATPEALLSKWSDSIPVEDFDSWREPTVADAYAAQAIGSDPTAVSRTPASLRTPLGAIADSFLLSRGHKLFEPGDIEARVLLIRSELDFWSRQVDVMAGAEALRNAASVETVELAGATHFVHLDRPERGRTQFVEAVINLLS